MFAVNKLETMTVKEFMEIQRTKKKGSEMTESIKSLVKDEVVEEMNFLIGMGIEEVSKTKSQRKRKQIKKMFLTTYSAALGLVLMATPTFAQTTTTIPNPEVLPNEINETLVTIQFICLSLAGGIAVLCFMAAGALKMFGMESKAKKWTMEILKGFAQILVAPVVIWAIAAIVKLFLKPFPGYIPF